MRLSRRKRCTLDKCESECLASWVAAPIVVIAVFFALGGPFLESIGLRFNSAITFGDHYTFATIGIIAAGIVSIIIGWIRRHEDGLWCFFDTLGVPGILLIVMYAIK